MPSPLSTEQLAALYQEARLTTPDNALRTLGEHVAGRPVYLAIGGYALHSQDAEIFDPAQPTADPVILRAIDDRTLANWGLRLSQMVPAGIGRGPDLTAPIIALRLGLLMRCLDTAFLHLETRESFGQKVLHHQLMKARFSKINAEAQRCLDELCLPRARGNLPALVAMQRIITVQFRQAAKLMGGHGYLEGSCHALEFLASVLAASVTSAAGDRALAAAGGIS